MFIKSLLIILVVSILLLPLKSISYSSPLTDMIQAKNILQKNTNWTKYIKKINLIIKKIDEKDLKQVNQKISDFENNLIQKNIDKSQFKIINDVLRYLKAKVNLKKHNIKINTVSDVKISTFNELWNLTFIIYWKWIWYKNLSLNMLWKHNWIIKWEFILKGPYAEKNDLNIEENVFRYFVKPSHWNIDLWKNEYIFSINDKNLGLFKKKFTYNTKTCWKKSVLLKDLYNINDPKIKLQSLDIINNNYYLVLLEKINDKESKISLQKINCDSLFKKTLYIQKWITFSYDTELNIVLKWIYDNKVLFYKYEHSNGQLYMYDLIKNKLINLDKINANINRVQVWKSGIYILYMWWVVFIDKDNEVFSLFTDNSFTPIWWEWYPDGYSKVIDFKLLLNKEIKIIYEKNVDWTLKKSEKIINLSDFVK